ncbi:group XIIA secretory phospholipase A2 [Agrilus planipennis]|uniref:Group XIIA secretory phospholipase A2 n=1 Tax=Agrilus planipennis TaxID=224129 RepID=A0A1W4WIS5_AGRPL|nr:group XIIA secretory phospholipase A2-like [Agrilus planipennis]XP_018323846.1 group XIIA secretory phospholipase A2 [Agrilus planipennis]
MDIPYGKIVIYCLTFIAYIYLGFGSGILENLRDAVLAAENVFGDVLQNVVTVAKNFKSIHEVFDAAVEENCVFKCPTAGVKPVPNRNHIPKGNGCGSLGLKIDSQYLPVGEMTKCCDQHDICYDTCNKDKELCDLEFRRCLYKYCESYKPTVGETIVKTCKGAAKTLFTGTMALGCKSYLDAQKEACYCPPTYGWKQKRKKYSAGDEL